MTAEDENYEKQQWHERRTIRVLDAIIDRWYELNIYQKSAQVEGP